MAMSEKLEAALWRFVDSKIDEAEYSNVWLEEARAIYSELGGSSTHFISFKEPCHFEFGVFYRAPDGDGFGQSRGSVCFPTLTLLPHEAMSALIAFERQVAPELFDGEGEYVPSA